MLILTHCSCCNVGMYEDDQHHVCLSCSETVCAKCANLGPCDADTNPAECPVCREAA